MLLQFVTVLQGVLAPALLVMALSVMLTVGEGRDKPLSAYWRLAGFVVGFAGAVVFAALRATAVITQRTFVNYPTLWCCVILDVAVFVIVLFARRITADWHNHRALLDIANLVAALAIAATTFRALPDVILRLTIFVEPAIPSSLPTCCCARSGFALGAAVAIHRRAYLPHDAFHRRPLVVHDGGAAVGSRCCSHSISPTLRRSSNPNASSASRPPPSSRSCGASTISAA